MVSAAVSDQVQLTSDPAELTPLPLQTLHKSCSRGECYVVDSEVITSGIPYQDYFYTVHRYCLTSISKHKSRLRWVNMRVASPAGDASWCLGLKFRVIFGHTVRRNKRLAK